MPENRLIPKIPEYITVHLGNANSPAQNVTIPFIDYVKNVASSEIYPTWNKEAIRANVLAQISFALNRVYTEFYRSQGKDFDITSSTVSDQNYIYGRNTFDTTDKIVDEVFNDYITRKGNIEPLAAKYCNGTTSTCDGLSQWGSEALANKGLNAYQILQTYYGNDIAIVNDAPIENVTESYPGYSIKKGMTGKEVLIIQSELNRISTAYPNIPKVKVDGFFGDNTEKAVKIFQQTFNLTPDGIVGKATWYKLIQLYIGLKKLSELYSEGLKYEAFNLTYPDAISIDSSGQKVTNLQYMLKLISEYNPLQPQVDINGIFDEKTLDAVINFQNNNNLLPTGIVDAKTWNLIYDEYSGILKSQANGNYVLTFDTKPFLNNLSLGSKGEDVTLVQEELNFISLSNPKYLAVISTGFYDKQTQNAVINFQKNNSLAVTGIVNKETWNMLRNEYLNAVSVVFTSPTQYPYKELTLGNKDSEINLNLKIKNSDDKYKLYSKPIMSIQTFLRTLSFYKDLPNLIPTSEFDIKTKNTVTSFQTQNNLVANGIINYETWDKIIKTYEETNK